MNRYKSGWILILFISFCINEASPQELRQWVARFAGDVKKGTNVATAITVDDSGYVFVTGWVTRKATGVDFATLKYSPDGEQHWVSYYSNSNGEDKAKAIAVDSGGNVYVTGSSIDASGGLDFATVKYDSNGAQKWVVRYNGTGNGEDVPVSVAVNDSLNVYVSGWSLGSGSNFDYATLKYDAAGTLKWVKRYNGPDNGEDRAYAMVLRGTSDVYVTGASTDTMLDYTTIKYNAASGDSLWLARYNGTGNGNDIARAIVLRSSSDVFITGGSQDALGKYDYATINYNSSGVLQWVSRYNGSANGDDQAYAIGVQSSSRVYVTGKSLQVGSFNDFVTVRYNQSSGDEDWVSAFNGTANDDDGAVAILGGGSPYVLGSSAGSGVGSDYALVQYSGSNGDENWNTRYNGPGNNNDIPYAMTSFGGGVIVTGSSMSGVKGSEYLTIKYVDKNEMKYRTFNQEDLIGKGVSLKDPIAIPNTANVRDTAYSRAYPKIKKGFAGAPGGLVLGNARADSAASYGWIRINKAGKVGDYVPHTSTSRGFDLFDGATFVGEKKNPKVAQHNNRLVGQLVALRLNIAASDAEVTPPTLGDLTYDDGDTSNHYNEMSLRQIASLVDNFLTYWKKYPSVNWTLLDSMLTRVNRAFRGPLRIVSKHQLVVTGVLPIDSVVFLQPGAAPLLDPLLFEPGSIDAMPVNYSLSQNYPNPFNPLTTIEFELPEESFVSIKIYDIMGREVLSLIENEAFDEGRHEIEVNANTLASGVYYYRLIVNNGQYHDVKKMVLLR